VIDSPFEIVPETGASSSASQPMGVFHGHGEQGETVSRYASKELLRLLATKLSQLDADAAAETTTNEDHRLAASQAIKETFLQVDETMDSSQGGGTTSGTTASIVLQLNNELF
jgi:hypothetical protein